jgi:glucose-1-phosphate adenylyltransferase
MLGVRSMVGDNCKFDNVVMMGADYFETDEEVELPSGVSEVPDVGVGNNSVIKNCIIDKNARIGSDVILSPSGLEEGWADELNGVYSRDGILVVVKNGIVPSGTKIGLD